MPSTITCRDCNRDIVFDMERGVYNAPLIGTYCALSPTTFHRPKPLEGNDDE